MGVSGDNLSNIKMTEIYLVLFEVLFGMLVLFMLYIIYEKECFIRYPNTEKCVEKRGDSRDF